MASFSWRNHGSARSCSEAGQIQRRKHNPRIALHLGLLGFVGALALTTPASAQQQPNSWAVAVGVSQLANSQERLGPRLAVEDARAFAQFLESADGGGYTAGHVALLAGSDATSKAIKKALTASLRKDAKSQDRLFLFLALPGIPEKTSDEDLYLLGYDSDAEDLRSTALPLTELKRLTESYPGKIVFLIDICGSGSSNYEGAALDRFLGSFAKNETQMGLLSSCLGGSVQANPDSGSGVFARYLLDGLKGEADSDGDKAVGEREIAAYVRLRVEAATNGQQRVRQLGVLSANAALSPVNRSPVSAAVPKNIRPAEGDEIASAMRDAIEAGTLLDPAPGNAWDLYQQFVRLPISQNDKDDATDDMVIALSGFAEKVLSAYRRGEQVIRLGADRYVEGARAFTYASQLDPDDVQLKAKATFLDGRALAAGKRCAEAIRVLEEAISYDPRASFGYNGLGICYLEQKLWNEALEKFQAASERAPNWIYPRANIALVYLQRGRYRDAEKELLDAIERANAIKRPYAYLHVNLGTLYLLQKKLTDAEKQFATALQISPGDPVARNNLEALANAYLRARQLDSAERAFKLAVQQQPSSAAVLEGLGDVYKAQGKPDLAVPQYTQALSNTTDPTVQSRIEEKLRATRPKPPK